MAAKLTPDEQQLVKRLTTLFSKALPAPERNSAGTLASGVVRLKKDVYATSELVALFEKADIPAERLNMFKATGVLVESSSNEWRLPDELPRAQQVTKKAKKLAATEPASASATAPVPAAEQAAEKSAASRPAPEAALANAPAEDAATEATTQPKPKAKTRTKRASRQKNTEKAEEEPVVTQAAAQPEEAAPAADEPAPSVSAEPAPATPSDAIVVAQPAELAEQPRAQVPAAPASPTRSTDKLALLKQVHVVRAHTQEATDIRARIVKLDPRLWFNGWLLTSPDAFTLFEPEILAIDEALRDSPTIGDGTLTLRELSYLIFGDEKFLSMGPKGFKLLRSLGIEDLLRFKRLPKVELQHHVPRRRQSMSIVVSENLDPWVNMRELMYGEGKTTILGERVHGILFGSGTVITEPRKLANFVKSLGAKKVTIKYWGDIDRAGLSILSQLTEAAEGDSTYDVEPFWEAYRLMIKKARKRFPNPEDNETTDQASVAIEGLELLEDGLTPRDRKYLKAVLDYAEIIPQEIVTIKDL